MDLDQLIAERAIYRQLVRFARAMDARDWQTLTAIASPEATADFGAGEVVGSTAMVDVIRSYLDNCGPTQHLLGNVLIEVDGDLATSEAYVADLHLGKGERQHLQFRTLGNYRDSWQRRQGQWLLVRRYKDNRATVGSLEVFA